MKWNICFSSTEPGVDHTSTFETATSPGEYVNTCAAWDDMVEVTITFADGSWAKFTRREG